MSVFSPIDKILCWSAATPKIIVVKFRETSIFTTKGRTYDASFHKVSRLPFRRITPLYHVVSAKSLQLIFLMAHSSNIKNQKTLSIPSPKACIACLLTKFPVIHEAGCQTTTTNHGSASPTHVTISRVIATTAPVTATTTFSSDVLQSSARGYDARSAVR